MVLLQVTGAWSSSLQGQGGSKGRRLETSTQLEIALSLRSCTSSASPRLVFAIRRRCAEQGQQQHNCRCHGASLTAAAQSPTGVSYNRMAMPLRANCANDAALIKVLPWHRGVPPRAAGAALLVLL